MLATVLVLLRGDTLVHEELYVDDLSIGLLSTFVTVLNTQGGINMNKTSGPGALELLTYSNS